MRSHQLRAATASSLHYFAASPVTGVVPVGSRQQSAQRAPRNAPEPAVRVSLTAEQAPLSLYTRDGRLAGATQPEAEGVKDDSTSVHIKARVRASVATEHAQRSARGPAATSAQGKVLLPSGVEHAAREPAVAEAQRLQGARRR